MAEIFKLPTSSYEELIKLFQAYANTKDGVSVALDEISQATGIPKTIVSKNNGFLVQIGVITSEGNKKGVTETGRALGRAYISKIDYEVERIWKEIVSDVDFLNRMVSAVRIRNGMDRANLVNHIVYSSGVKDSKESRAGAGAIIEIFKSAGFFNEVDGKLTVKEETDFTSQEKVGQVLPPIASEFSVSSGTNPVVSTTKNGITINININCTADDLDMLGSKIQKFVEQIYN